MRLAMGWRISLLCLWLCIAVHRSIHLSGESQDTELGVENWQFAPERLLPKGSSSATTLLIWKSNSHLRPRYHNHIPPDPYCYWLLILAGDVELNPGPTKYPCTVCKKAVRSNQHGLCCNGCELWTHAKCCGIAEGEYQRMARLETFSWRCPLCICTELPFSDSSLLNVSLSLADQSNTSQTFSPLDECTSRAVFCHLNTQSLINKMD